MSPQQLRNYQLEKDDTDMLLLVFHLVQAFGSVKSFFT